MNDDFKATGVATAPGMAVDIADQLAKEEKPVPPPFNLLLAKSEYSILRFASGLAVMMTACKWTWLFDGAARCPRQEEIVAVLKQLLLEATAGLLGEPATGASLVHGYFEQAGERWQTCAAYMPEPADCPVVPAVRVAYSTRGTLQADLLMVDRTGVFVKVARPYQRERG